jgi:hypothetical protein
LSEATVTVVKPSEFQERVQHRLDEYRVWAKIRTLTSGRLVQYSGLGIPNAIDVEVSAIPSQIEGCLNEGLQVNWSHQESTIYLAIQEPDCSMPPWEKVFAEEAVSDVAEINPFVVKLARALLTLTGVVLLILCAGLFFSGVEITDWAWMLTFSLGILSLLSACFESPPGVVTTVIIFFYP